LKPSTGPMSRLLAKEMLLHLSYRQTMQWSGMLIVQQQECLNNYLLLEPSICQECNSLHK
jgi:hypothetical protein